MNSNTMGNGVEAIENYRLYKMKCANLLDVSSISYGYDQEHLKSSHQEMRKELSKLFKDVDFREFTRDELLKFLDFGAWDEDLVLCPVWTNGLLKNGTEVYTISDKVLVVGEDVLGTDTRFGCFAHGFKIEQLRDFKLKNIIE